MRIGIDVRLHAYRPGGIALYARQLLTAMAPLASHDQFLALQHLREPTPQVQAPNVRRATLITPPHNRYEQLSLPLELWPRRLDVIHFPDFIAPRRRPCPAVITIHDLAFIHFPEILDAEARRFYRQVKAAAHDAEAVITVSQATRADIASLLDLPPERVEVIYEAADPAFTPQPLAPGSRRTIGGHPLQADQFLLFLSTVEPRKNLATLLHALRVCLDRKPQADYHLVVAGERGWLADPIYALVRELRLDRAVSFLGRVGGEDQRWLYRACRIYLNPSRYEGFGLPVLEALASGAPSIVADNSSLPEVAGNAARLVPTMDVVAWAEAISDLWEDATARAELARLGPLRAAEFSWARAAKATLAVYRRVGR